MGWNWLGRLGPAFCLVIALAVIATAFTGHSHHHAAMTNCQPGQHSSYGVSCSPHRWIWDSF